MTNPFLASDRANHQAWERQVAAEIVALAGSQSDEPKDEPGGGLDSPIGTSVQPISWPRPLPLSVERPPLPAFPIGSLPIWIQDEVTAVAEFTQTPIDAAAMLALAVVAAIAGGAVEVEARPGWREPVNLYVLIALPPASRKSAVFRELTSALLQVEKRVSQTAAAKIAEVRTSKKIAEDRANRLAESAAKTGDAADHADAIAAATAAEAINVPALPRLVVDDITLERLGTVLAEQSGRLAVLSAEGTLLSILMGRYTASPNVEILLKAHSGDMLRVDRGGRPPDQVDRPALTLGLMIQPELLRDVGKAQGLRGRGLLARLLYVLPENNFGRRRVDVESVPELVRTRYDANVAALHGSLMSMDRAATIQFSPDAGRQLLDLGVAVENRLGAGGPWAEVQDWGGKYVGVVVRIAGLLHVAERVGMDSWRSPIPADVVNKAIAIGDYLAAHALAVRRHAPRVRG